MKKSTKKTVRPIKYKHPTAKGFMIKKTTMTNPTQTGTLLEFKYGTKQKPGQVGGWKNDPRPSLLVFYDDGAKYIEGINLHYLSYYYVLKLRKLMIMFPGINGKELYDVVKRSAAFAVKKGYRKYIRSSVLSPQRLVPAEQLRDAMGKYTGQFVEIGNPKRVQVRESNGRFTGEFRKII